MKNHRKIEKDDTDDVSEDAGAPITMSEASRRTIVSLDTGPIERVGEASIAPQLKRPDSDNARLEKPPPGLTRGGISPRALRRVRDYIESHLGNRVHVDSLAELSGLSKYHFARTFKASVGTTPHNYVLNRRVERAKELLSSSGLPLINIALVTGFSDQSHFSRLFREKVGVPPSFFRSTVVQKTGARKQPLGMPASPTPAEMSHFRGDHPATLENEI